MVETTPAEAAALPDELEAPGEPVLAVRRYGAGSGHRGRGPGAPVPVVLLHGLGGTLEEWDGVARILAAHRPVFSADLRGHGRSGDASWCLDGFVDDLIRLLGHLGVERPLVVGNDLGGAVAACAASRRSDLAGAVNLDGVAWPDAERAARALGMAADAAGIQVDLARAYATEQLAASRTPQGAEEFARCLEGLRAMGDEGPMLEASVIRAAAAADGLVALRPGPRGMRAAMDAFDEFVPERVYPRLLVPLLSLVSTGSLPAHPGAPSRFADVVRAAASAELARTAPLLRTGPIEQTAHHPHVTHPAVVAGAVEGFLAEIGG
ncbi:alpha/beta hydrolase [Nocardiopsis sp. RSe5-2]|uniref:Alpha/beta hydrolase n=1 Tax=Nocardiopsis endophytica TaxID=3018445 RepID=A0ABT4U671_9ACTN|nr:alpha/beta hydrolase [Nocardiopsis endophytica]MDA2812440.1 alpha/beta hydrolase [Nocardiopsis endophytica]